MGTKTTRIVIYLLEYKTLICPYSEIPAGSYCCSLFPLKQVDPRNKYQYVIDVNGNTHTVSRKCLHELTRQIITYQRKPLTSYSEELLAKVDAAGKALSNYLKIKSNV